MTETKRLILDIALNLNRIGNWAADGYDEKQKRILLFLDQTKGYVRELNGVNTPKIVNVFLPTFKRLYAEGQSKPKHVDAWVESCMTWGNILTHRASLLP
jgi:hypothetical protein